MSLFLDTTSKSSFTQRADAATPRTAQAAVESDDAAPDVKQTIGAALKKAGEAASTFGGTLTARFDEARKNSAREQIAQVQQRIQMLKRMILLFGGSKALLRELKQLAGTLATAAKTLKEDGNSTNTATFIYNETGAPPNQHGMPTEAPAPSDTSMPESNKQQEAQAFTGQVQRELADSASSSEEEASNPQSSSLATLAPAGSQQSQRHADAKLLAETLRELKALVAAAKAAQHKPDREDQKHINEIDKHLEKVEQAIGSLNAPTAPIFAGISIHV
ncbi:hypothetical protein [Stutzerimonas stutzeri]|uniref:hypothetical protein n=1 Tax=Stutzerimonas stutzeri TaxID=316 RepID=UPI0021091F37|nr:hypothetical protein [Stutzerimonas stutzeri]MCQ4241698.1 hypothetical protein [Stutzerimonas stutzeri]